MEFTSKDYTNEDFRKEQDLFTQFYYDEVSGAPGFTWCTEYFYRKLENGRYQLVYIDSFDNELYLHEEYATAQDFAEDIKRDTEPRELEPYIDDEILALFPDDLKEDKEEAASYFNEITASLIHIALEEGDRELVKAFLPNFANIRSAKYPAPYILDKSKRKIPKISESEMKRRREILRNDYRSRGYIEESPYYFVKRDYGRLRTVEIGYDRLITFIHNTVGVGRIVTYFEDIKNLPDV